MENLSFDVQGIGRVKLIQDCGSSLTVEDASGTRMSLPASRCVRVDQTAAALADQFTGEDLGAAMAAAEGFNHSQQVAKPGDCVSTAVGDSEVLWVIPTPGGWVYGVRLTFCPSCRVQVLMGDEFDPCRPSEGYRVGDAHEGGEG